MNKRVLIAGVGGVGTFAAHLLTSIPGVDLFLGDVRADFIPYKVNSAIDVAFYMYPEEHFPSVQAVDNIAKRRLKEEDYKLHVADP